MLSALGTINDFWTLLWRSLFCLERIFISYKKSVGLIIFEIFLFLIFLFKGIKIKIACFHFWVIFNIFIEIGRYSLYHIEILDMNHMLHPQEAPHLNFFSNLPRYSNLIVENRFQDMSLPKNKFYRWQKNNWFRICLLWCFH